MRRARRYRKTRYRQPRFNNRAKPQAWLPPSINSRLQNTLTWVNRLAKLLPVREIHAETNVFDPHLLRNPDVSGTQYQQGPLYRTNLRAAVLQRDGGRCVYCNKSGKRNKLELDHAVPKSRGGQDRYDNLLASCTDCNRKRGNQPLEEWLGKRPRTLRKVRDKLGEELADAAHMNVIIPKLISELEKTGWKVIRHSAATTAAGRIACGVEKSHHADAAVTGCPSSLTYLPDRPINITATGRGTRQRIMPDRFRHPKGKGIPGVLKTTQTPEADHSRPQPQEETEKAGRRQHRGLRRLRTPRPTSTWARDHIPCPSSPHQTIVAKHQGRESKT